MRPQVKFCGFTREEDVQAAQVLGAEYIGFVLVPSSPRNVSLERAIQLRELCSAKCVAVLEHATEAANVFDVMQPDFLQLHDHEGLPPRLDSTVIRALRGLPDHAALQEALDRFPYVLIDKASGQNLVDIVAVAGLSADVRGRLFLAGGLDETNVAGFVAQAHPFAVDTARGIESKPGIKDIDRMAAFISSLSSQPS